MAMRKLFRELSRALFTDIRTRIACPAPDDWISSIDLENEAVGCPGIAEAAVIAVSHPNWQLFGKMSIVNPCCNIGVNEDFGSLMPSLPLTLTLTLTLNVEPVKVTIFY